MFVNDQERQNQAQRAYFKSLTHAFSLANRLSVSSVPNQEFLKEYGLNGISGEEWYKFQDGLREFLVGVDGQSGLVKDLMDTPPEKIREFVNKTRPKFFRVKEEDISSLDKAKHKIMSDIWSDFDYGAFENN